jgi:hypothetical protein
LLICAAVQKEAGYRREWHNVPHTQITLSSAGSLVMDLQPGLDSNAICIIDVK